MSYKSGPEVLGSIHNRIKEKGISMYEKIIKDIEFENGHYKVRLPFKENHAVIPDYYELCKNRLSKLYNRLSQDRNL